MSDSANAWPPESFVQVTREQFYRQIGKMNVHPFTQGAYPYASEWRDVHTRVLEGWSKADVLGVEHYYLPARCSTPLHEATDEP